MATTKHNKIKLREVNRHLVCRLCRGYYVDATTIAECLHSFCRSCIIKYLEKNSFCPICEVQIHKTKPYLSLRLDKALQDVVYKVVPGLYHDEMRRRREFYSEQKERLSYATPEQCGLEERIIFSPEDSISLSLEYLDSDYLENETVSSQSSDSGDTQDGFALSQHLNLKLRANDKSSRRESQDTQEPSFYPKRYLQCPAVVNIGHLKKFVRMKHELHSTAPVDIIHKRVPLPDHYTLMDVAYIYTWKRSAPLRLFYQIYKTKKQKVIVPASVPEAKKAESHPLKDLNKEKSEVNEKVEKSGAVTHASKANKNVNGAVLNPVVKLTSEAQKTAGDLIASKTPNAGKSGPENKTKESAKSIANVNAEIKRDGQSSGKDKAVSPFKSKTSDKIKLSDKVTIEVNSKAEKSCASISTVQKLNAEEVKENKLNNERLLLNPVSGQLESVPFDDYSNPAMGRVEEKKDKVNVLKKEKEIKKESPCVKKIKLSKNECESVKKEKMYRRDSMDVKKEKINRRDSEDVKKEAETIKKEKINKKELVSVKKEKFNKKDSESVRKDKEQKKESENGRNENECEKEQVNLKKENEQKKVSDGLRKEKEQNRESEIVKKEESENVKKEVESVKESENGKKEKEQKGETEILRKHKESKKEEERDKKSNLNMLKSFRKEKQLTKEGKIELKTSNGSTLTITALPRAEKPPETETSKASTEVKEENVYDFDGSSSPDKSDLFSKQSKHSKSKYLVEHRDKWLAKEAAGEWMTFQEYREMLLKENNATENVCTRAKRKSVPNLFRISPEENKRSVNKEYFGKPEEISKEKKSPTIMYNIYAKEEDKKTASKNKINSPPRPIKIENKDGEYFIKRVSTETNEKRSPEAEKQSKSDKFTLYQKLMGNYQAKVDEANKKLKAEETSNKNFGAIDLTKGETNSKERKNESEKITDNVNKTSPKQDDKTPSKTNAEPVLKVPQYSQNLKNMSKDWPPVTKNLSPNDLSQAFLHLKHLDAINQFNPNAVLEQFAKKTGNLDLLYQQKIDFIRRLKRHQQAVEDILPEKKQKFSPSSEKKHSPTLDAKEKTRPTSEEVAALKNAEDLKTLSRIQDLLEIQRAMTQNFKMPPALLQFYSRPRPYPPPIASSLSNSQPQSPSHPKSQNLGSPSGSLPLPLANASLLDSPNYGHLLSAAGLHTEMSFHQTFKNYLRRQEDNPQLPNLPLLKKPPRLKDESGKSISDKHHSSKTPARKESTASLDTPET